MAAVIELENLGKKYLLSHQRTQGKRYIALRDVLANKVNSLFSKTKLVKNEQEEFWALQNINLEIPEGSKVGIIGRNGAGKSTLLKLLSKITTPSTGRITLRGRVASLLEVGTGFHPELSGRENIFFNGSILGMRREEILSKFDEIVDFSGIEKFLDTPVKRYSSGMRLRLGFAVAAHLESEILLIDEVLAVGDAEFQKKCLGKMDDVSRKEGRTVIFVSHNMLAIRSLCSSAICIGKGQILDQGTPDQVVDRYLDVHGAPEANKGLDIVQNNIKLEVVEPCDDRGNLKSAFSFEQEIFIHTHFESYIDSAKLNVSLVLYSVENVAVFNSYSESVSLDKGKYKFSCKIPSHLLNGGFYYVRILLVKDSNIPLMDLRNTCSFEVYEEERGGEWFGKQIGVIKPSLEWNIHHVR